jgi:hypothetical protein
MAVNIHNAELQIEPMKPFVVVNCSPVKETCDVDAPLDGIVRNVKTC